jgi:hypothetical protein
LGFGQQSMAIVVGKRSLWGATIWRCVIAAAINRVTYQDLNSNMSLLGQQRSLEALLLAIKAQISVKQGILLREQRRLVAESATLEALLQKRSYEQSIRMQSHLATHAIDRLTGLSERAAQAGLFTTGDEALLSEEFAKADRRFNARMLLVEGVLVAQDERSLDLLRATRRLDLRKDFVYALHQHERQEAILKLAGEIPEAIQHWKDAERPHIDAHAANDPAREAILTAGDKPQIDDKELKAAKARYLASLSEVTILVDQVRHLESLSATTEGERHQVERQAKTESHMLGKLYATHLFNGKSELDAYQLASESLSAACEMHFRRLEATHESALARYRKQVDELLSSGNTPAIEPISAKGFRDRANKALSDRSVDALAQICRELAELFDLAELAKGNSGAARVFGVREHSSTTVFAGAAALAGDAPGNAAQSEAYKASETGREWEEVVQADAPRQQESGSGEYHHIKM